MMKYLIILLGILLISSTYALDNIKDIGTYEKNSCIRLWETCSNCTYVNITELSDPSGQSIITNKLMTKQGTMFNYSYCITNKTGDYIYRVIGDLNGQTVTENIKFNIKTFNEKNINITWIILWIFMYVITYFLLIYNSKIPLYQMFGYILMLLNSVIGIGWIESPIGYIALGITLILVADKTFKLVQIAMKS